MAERFSPVNWLRGDALGQGAELAVVQSIGILELRIPRDDEEGRRLAGEALACALPSVPRTEAGSADLSVLWLSLDRWWVLTERDRLATLQPAIERALGSRPAAIVDVSAGSIGFRVAGPKVPSLLIRASASDLTRMGFTPGLVRFFLLGQLKALLRVRSVDSGQFTAEILVPRSYADYALDVLRESAGSPGELQLVTRRPPPTV